MMGVLAKNRVVEYCIAVDSVADLIEIFPSHALIQEAGEENVGWTYDGLTFAPPG